MTSVKGEALDAITHARKILESPDAMNGRLRVGLVLEALAFACDRIEHIEELKRSRRKPKETTL